MMKSGQGCVPAIMPRLPKSVDTKLMSDDAVPISFLTILSRTSIANGRMMASMIVKGRKPSRKQSGPCTERIEQNGRKCRNGKYQARDSLVGHTVRELQIQDRTGNGCNRIYGIIEAVCLRREVEFIDVDEGRDGQAAI